MSAAAAMAHTDPRVDINTTPLVDVMLVLLIIFMITAPLLSHRVDAILPQPGPPKPQPDTPIEVSLRSIGGQWQLYWDGEAVSNAALTTRLQQTARLESPPPVLLRADDTVPYQRVTDTLALAQQSGLRALTIDPLAPQ
ncbi:MAG: biopolymer transporter ExbD [Lysobacterales bacterium]